MTGKEVFEMIVNMQTEAKRQNGSLTDLALPEDLYFALVEYLPIDNPKDATGRLTVYGTPIHMGEDD